jgi:hypothetical protein
MLLVGACSLNAGDGPPLHHPDLRLAKLAKTGEANCDVFKSYNANGPSSWNQGWPWKFDLTGIGWDGTTTVTAITPRHVVMADHYRRKAGSPAVFHDRKGKPHRRVIQKVLSAGDFGYRSDVAIGLLDLPLPKSIRNYPLLKSTEEELPKLIGALALVTDQKRRLYFHQIQYAGSDGIIFQFDSGLADFRHKRLVVGDSGNPSFLLSHGELVLVETHTGGGPGIGPCYGSPELVGTIRKIVANLDSSYQLRTVGIDGKVFKDAEMARASMPEPRAFTPSPVQPEKRPRPRIVPHPAP